MNPPDPSCLFSRGDLRSLLEGKKRALLSEIEQLDESHILSTDLKQLVAYLREKYLPTAPTLADGLPEIVGREERKLEANPYARIPTGSHIVGTEITFAVEFSGDPDLFYYAPSAFSSIQPHGTVGRNGEIIFSLISLGQSPEQLRIEAERNVSTMRQYVAWVAADLKRFENEIVTVARQRIDARRQQLRHGDELVKAMGFPIRKRDDQSGSLFIPQVRKKVVPQPPEPPTKPSAPEPALSLADYEDILSTICHMASVLERNPRAFAKMNESDLRWLFLIPLNGVYEGQATGETFNFTGKTDILIRFYDRNVFVAECAFWRGPEYLRQKIDQLLGYATWRDSKLAILVFNRGRNFSDVLAKIPQVVKDHPNFTRELPFDNSSGFRCVVAHRDDPNRELILTVCAFEVPE